MSWHDIVHPNRFTSMKTARQQNSKLQLTSLLKASFLFEAAIHPMRQQLIGLLIKEGTLTASAICDLSGIEDALCVQQLSILCETGLLVRHAEFGVVFYSVQHQKLQQLYQCADALLDA